MSEDARNIDDILDGYRQQVLRWNGQINLVSRQDTAGRLNELINQCRDGWDNLAASGAAGLADVSRLWYFDLGSGAGLPGFVWHVQMVAAGLGVQSLLVEPREKRAWFLERVASLAGEEAPRVFGGRWGEPGMNGPAFAAAKSSPSHVLVSLKALHLSDTVVLRGLEPYLESSKEVLSAEIPLLIARFYPPDQPWTSGLAAELEIPPAGHLSRYFRSEGGRVLRPAAPTGASLVLSEYRILVP